jgi:hypothetical protein
MGILMEAAVEVPANEIPRDDPDYGFPESATIIMSEK